MAKRYEVVLLAKGRCVTARYRASGSSGGKTKAGGVGTQ